MRRIAAGVISVAILLWPAALLADVQPAPSPWSRPLGSVEALALQWFNELQAGQVDRSRLSPAYDRQLTDDALSTLSHYLKPYGQAQTAEVVESRTLDTQTFFLYRIIFKRGDVLEMLIAYDTNGKITGVTFPAMGQS